MFDNETRSTGYRSRRTCFARYDTRPSCRSTRPPFSPRHWVGSHRITQRTPMRRPALSRVAGDRWPDQPSPHRFGSAPEFPDVPNWFPFCSPCSRIGAQGRKTERDDRSRTFERPQNTRQGRATRAAAGTVARDLPEISHPSRLHKRTGTPAPVREPGRVFGCRLDRSKPTTSPQDKPDSRKSWGYGSNG